MAAAIGLRNDLCKGVHYHLCGFGRLVWSVMSAGIKAEGEADVVVRAIMGGSIGAEMFWIWGLVVKIGLVTLLGQLRSLEVLLLFNPHLLSISNTSWGRRTPDILGHAHLWFVGGFMENFLGLATSRTLKRTDWRILRSLISTWDGWPNG